MDKRPYSKSLRGKITNRTLMIGILPVLLVGAFSWFSLTRLTTNANDMLDRSRAELLDSVVGNNLATTAARIVNQLDGFMLERISDVSVWASAPIVIEAAKRAAEDHITRGLDRLPIEQVEAQFETRKSLNVSPAANRYLLQQIRRSSHFGEVFFTDRFGFNTALTNPTSDFVQRDENWWKTAWENGVSIGEVEFDDSAGIWSIDISVRIDDPTSGRSLGVMKAVLGVTLIQEVADNAARDIPGGSVIVANSGGLLLAETGSAHDQRRIMVESVNLRNSKDPAIRGIFGDEPQGYVIGTDSVLAFSRSAGAELYRTVVTRFPGFNWSVVVQQPTSIALAPLAGLASVQDSLRTSRQQILVILALVVILVFVSAVIVAGLLSRTITRPLLDLRELADSVSKGDTSKTISVDSDDEIQDVAQAFERMRTSVSIIMKRIKDMKAGRGQA